MVHAHDLAAVVVLAVALISLGLALVAYQSIRRTGNRRLRFVMAAFTVFFVKGIVVTWAIWTGSVAHEHLELVSSLFDLVTISLLVMPLVR